MQRAVSDGRHVGVPGKVEGGEFLNKIDSSLIYKLFLIVNDKTFFKST